MKRGILALSMSLAVNTLLIGPSIGTELAALPELVAPPEGTPLEEIPVPEETPAIEEPPSIEEIPVEEIPEAEALVEETYQPIRSATTCPTDIETLTTLLIRDIPYYTNRVLQRTTAVLEDNNTDEISELQILIDREPYRPSFVLIAGRPELEPVDLNEYAFTTDSEAGGPVRQLFFTTLSRQYSGLKVNELQEYHWLFLTQAYEGWWLAFMYSAIDDVDTARTFTPPRESSEGSVGQAVQLWLRDCRAGAIDRLE